MQLSREQRWILSNQYRILELLDKENAEGYATAREAIENGYEDFYDEISQYIYEDTLSKAESDEVFQIMHMFDQIEHAYDTMSLKPDVQEYDLRFSGFDGNTETSYMAYARFLIEKADRFQRFAGRGDNLNSHMPTLDVYRRMLRVWEKLPREHRLHPTVEDIERLINEAVHPSNRS